VVWKGDNTIPGYKNPVITLRFDELGDGCHVVIRNPLLMPAAELTSMAGGRTDADREAFEAARAAVEAGQQPEGDVLSGDDENRIWAMISRLIVGWRVWDPTAPIEIDDDGNLAGDDAEPPRLGLPATPELVGKLPQVILTRIMEEFSKANPQGRPPGQEDGTSRTS
jgi:hypothetical protein